MVSIHTIILPKTKERQMSNEAKKSGFNEEQIAEVRKILESMEKNKKRVEILMKYQPFHWATQQTPNLTPKQIALQLYDNIWD